MKRARGIRLGAAAVAAGTALAAIVGCAGLQDVGLQRASDYLRQRTSDNVNKVTDNAMNAAIRGDLHRSASFTMEQEFYIGKTIAASVTARLGGRALDPEHPVVRYLRDVGTVVALSAAEQRGPDDRPYPKKGFRFILVDAPQVNAVGMPGGFVVVTAGALRACRSEDELAAILAHEVAHVQLGHAIAPLESAREQEHMTDTVLAGTDALVHAFFGKVVAVGTDFVLDKGYGKANELGADAAAARTLERAGYDPAALPAFLARLEGPAAAGGFFARHPAAVERVSALGRGGHVMTVSLDARTARFQERLRRLR